MPSAPARSRRRSSRLWVASSSVMSDEQAVHQDVAQESLVGMAVGVDEAGNDDSVRGVDDRDRIARRLDVRPNLADPVALDQYVRLREVADLPVEGEDDAALEQNAAFTLDAGKLGVGGAGALREGLARQHLRRRAAGRECGARCEKTASRRSAGGSLTMAA